MIVTATDIRRVNRVRELNRMSKAGLERLRKESGVHVLWTAGRETKEEVIKDILEAEGFER